MPQNLTRYNLTAPFDNDGVYCPPQGLWRGVKVEPGGFADASQRLRVPRAGLDEVSPVFQLVYARLGRLCFLHCLVLRRPRQCLTRTSVRSGTAKRQVPLGCVTMHRAALAAEMDDSRHAQSVREDGSRNNRGSPRPGPYSTNDRRAHSSPSSICCQRTAWWSQCGHSTTCASTYQLRCLSVRTAAVCDGKCARSIRARPGIQLHTGSPQQSQSTMNDSRKLIVRAPARCPR